jgi:hypothetical protein
MLLMMELRFGAEITSLDLVKRINEIFSLYFLDKIVIIIKIYFEVSYSLLTRT